jgi:hypothetical protein
LTTDQEGDATAALRVRVRLPMDGLVVLADTSAEPTASSEISAREKDVKRPNLGAASVVVTPQTWSVIRPGETVSLALYLRATRLGVVDAPFVVCYEPPEPAPPSLRYRLARVEARIQVTPSLAIHARVSASATHPAARVVRVAARNVSASSTFFVRAVRLLAADDEGRNDVCLRPAVRVYGQLVRSAASSKTQTRGLLIEPGKARDAVFLAGPAEALVANDAVRENDEKDENVSDVVSYVGLEVDASFDDAEVDAAHVAALERLVRASLSFAASAKSAKALSASRHEKASSKGPERDGRRDPNPPTKGFAAFRGDKSVVVEWEAVSNESGARLFFGAHAFSASRSFALPDAKEDENDGHFFRDHRDTRDVGSLHAGRTERIEYRDEYE